MDQIIKKKKHYLYLWRNPYNNRTCYGVTGNLETRRSKYEGHTGFDVEFSYILEGDALIIKEIENLLKEFVEKFDLAWNNKEWIISNVPYDSIVDSIEGFRKQLKCLDSTTSRNSIEEQHKNT